MSQERCSQHEVYLDAHPAANKSAVPSHFPLLMRNTHTHTLTHSFSCKQFATMCAQVAISALKGQQGLTFHWIDFMFFFSSNSAHSHISCSQWTFQLISWCETANHWQEKWLLSLSTSHITLTSEFCCDELLRHCRCLTSAYMSVHCSVVSAPTGKITSTWTLKLILWWWNLLNSNPKRGLAHLRAWKH